jgi:hypothetical protein
MPRGPSTERITRRSFIATSPFTPPRPRRGWITRMTTEPSNGCRRRSRSPSLSTSRLRHLLRPLRGLSTSHCTSWRWPSSVGPNGRRTIHRGSRLPVSGARPFSPPDLT